MLRVALMSNRLPNRMSCLPAVLPIQITAAQWNLNSTHNCVTKSKTVNVSSHYCISRSKYHIIQSIMLWISNTNMLSIDILSYLHKALPLINKQSGLLPVITGFKDMLLYSCCRCLVTTFPVSICIVKILFILLLT